MTSLELRIFGNANWRADSNQTAAEVAAELNAARIVLRRGSNYTLLGLQQQLGTVAVAAIEYAVSVAAAQLEQGTLEQQVQAVGLRQLLDALRIGNGPDFGLAETQASLAALAGVLTADQIAALQGLGISETLPEVTAEDVTAAWSALAAFETRQTILADLSRLVGTLSGELHDPLDFADTLADLQTYVAGL